jgi:heme o synthase
VPQVKTVKAGLSSIVLEKVKDIGILMKFKLSLTVVFSAVMSYLIAIKGDIVFSDLLVLFLGGLFTSGAASGLNQVLEKDFDTMMKRTENRPIAAGRMTVSEGVLISGLMCLLGISLLAYFNPISAFLGMISLVSYAFVYTPVKRISNIAVTIGAFPGALPIVIGCTAAQNGVLTPLAIALFAIQFIWQFPHFFAIAWLGDEDYKKAGFKLLPTKEGVKDSNTGKQSLIYSLMLVPLSWIPFYLGATSWISAVYLTVLALIMAYFAFNFYKKDDRKTALIQMFYSIAYLPLALIGLYLDKI